VGVGVCCRRLRSGVAVVNARAVKAPGGAARFLAVAEH
jgi:hypothetical protein